MPNEIVSTKDGSHSMRSERFGVMYHSIHGAVQETCHVFIQSGLHFQMQRGYEAVSILEIGWGTGLNSYMTLLDEQAENIPIQYTTLEAYPISLENASGLNYAEKLGQPSSDAFLEMHESPWDTAVELRPNFTFTKRRMRFQDIRERAAYDLIYFDAFAPNAQPELWEAGFLTKMHAALRTNGVLVTYCAKGAFKRALKAVGFEVQSIPGPPGKREMTRALKND